MCQTTNTSDAGRNTQKGRAAKPCPGAFTLVELLVVISIIALLLAIAIPSYTAAREHACLSICQSNMRQLTNMSLEKGAESSILGNMNVKTFAYTAQLSCPKSTGQPTARGSPCQ